MRIFPLFLHKSDHWAYKQEARIFYPLSASEKRSFDGPELVVFLLDRNQRLSSNVN